MRNKRTISSSGRLGVLQMISKLDTELYAREDVARLEGNLKSHFLGS